MVCGQPRQPQDVRKIRTYNHGFGSCGCVIMYAEVRTEIRKNNTKRNVGSPFWHAWCRGVPTAVDHVVERPTTTPPTRLESGGQLGNPPGEPGELSLGGDHDDRDDATSSLSADTFAQDAIIEKKK